MPPASGQVDIWDELLPGFAVRIGKTGRRSFFVGTRVRGRYRRITLKPPYPMLTLADAREQARRIMADAHAGIAPELRRRREERGTFGALCTAFATDYASKLRTGSEYQRIINTDLAGWRDRQVRDITRGDIKELIRVKARTAPYAANRLKALISKIFNWAVKEEVIDASPAIGLDSPGQEVARARSLSAEEIRTAWSAFDKVGYPWGQLNKMLLVTGQRKSEVAGMKWSEITADGWRIPNERAKRGKGHLVPLSSLGREILADTPQIGEYVFRSDRGDKPLQGWSRALGRVQKLCGPMEPWRLHDLRRTFATQLRSIGVDRLVVSKLLNHTEGGVTRIYDLYSADPEKSAAMERWANRLREIVL